MKILSPGRAPRLVRTRPGLAIPIEVADILSSLPSEMSPPKTRQLYRSAAFLTPLQSNLKSSYKKSGGSPRFNNKPTGRPPHAAISLMLNLGLPRDFLY